MKAKNKKLGGYAGRLLKEMKRCISGLNLSKKQESRLCHLSTEYCRSLARIEKASPKAKVSMSHRLIFGSFASRVCAVVQSVTRYPMKVGFDEIIGMAKALEPWKALSEPVIARWEPKSKGFRIICMDGPMRRAQRLLVRDVVELTTVESPYDYSRRGGGGERKLISDVIEATEDNPWWVASDVKDCFPSLRPAHFKWLPLDERMVNNVAFLPECAIVKVIIPEDPTAVMNFLGVTSTNDLIAFTMEKVRQGLSQGSVLSPLLARRFLGREIRAEFGSGGVFVGSWVDDLAIGACSKKQVNAAVEAFTKRLASHPAGPIILKSDPPHHIDSWKVCVLGYFLEPGNGKGGTTHVKPGPKRFSKFRAKLKERLAKAGPDEDLMEVGLTYWGHWFPSQLAWTKIPGFSRRNSELITMTYVEDFQMGIPMGGYWNSTAK